MAPDVFSDIELDALRELMNVGFGLAAVSLSEVIDMHVTLSVPKISVLDALTIPDFIGRETSEAPAYSMIEQFFFGRFSGTSFLLVPKEEGKKLAALYSGEFGSDPVDIDMGSLERESVVEIGNIVIGACVGKIAEILKDQVTFQPPRYIGSTLDKGQLRRYLSDSDGVALVFKTMFTFAKVDVYGLLFLIASSDSIVWMKKAVDEYIESFA